MMIMFNWLSAAVLKLGVATPFGVAQDFYYDRWKNRHIYRNNHWFVCFVKICSRITPFLKSISKNVYYSMNFKEGKYAAIGQFEIEYK